jgi:hypothetical protein
MTKKAAPTGTAFITLTSQDQSFQGLPVRRIRAAKIPCPKFVDSRRTADADCETSNSRPVKGGCFRLGSGEMVPQPLVCIVEPRLPLAAAAARWDSQGRRQGSNAVADQRGVREKLC